MLLIIDGNTRFAPASCKVAVGAEVVQECYILVVAHLEFFNSECVDGYVMCRERVVGHAYVALAFVTGLAIIDVLRNFLLRGSHLENSTNNAYQVSRTNRWRRCGISLLSTPCRFPTRAHTFRS